MKKKIKKHWGAFLTIVVMFAFVGCGEMLDNPTIDKDTGEDVNFLIVDFNFFTTRMSFKFIDAADNSIINQPAKMWFTGTHAKDIVDFAGEKHADFTISEGQMELTVDPNIVINETTPLQFAVNIEIDGYNTLSQGKQINSIGKKTFEFLLQKETSGDDTVLTGEEDGDGFIFGSASETIKSAKVEEKPYKTSYRILKADLLKFKDYYGQTIFASEAEMMDVYEADKDNFLKVGFLRNFDSPTIIDRLKTDDGNKMVSFKKLEYGTLQDLILGGRRVVDLNGGVITQTAEYLETPKPDIFGFAEFKTDAWEIPGTTINHTTANFSYTLASASLETLCATGSTIKFASNKKSSFSIDADFFDTNDKLISTINFKGNFPESFTLENMPAQSARVVFRDNNPSFKPIDELNIDNLCSGLYEVDVDAADGYQEYQIVLKALCPDNATVSVAPTYSGEIRIKGSDDAWQGIDMIGGIADFLAKPNQDYEFRLLWKGDWETADFHTKIDANGNYKNDTDYNITSEILDDGRTRIKVVHEFDQAICDDMNW